MTSSSFLLSRPQSIHCQRHLSAGATERKFAHRASQSHAQVLNSPPAPLGHQPPTRTPAGAPSRLVPRTLGAPAYHPAALRFTLALASLDLGLCLGRWIYVDEQTAPTTPAVPKSFGNSTCRSDASGIVAAIMDCAFWPDAEAEQSRRPDQTTG